MAKSTKISNSTRQAIVKYKNNNPEATANEVASRFNVTPEQVNYAYQLDKAGKLKRGYSRKPPKLPTDTGDVTTDELLDKEYRSAVLALSLDENINASERVDLLVKITNVRKYMQQIRLESHMKKTDAGILAIIIRRFMPEATEDTIIQIYKEAESLWKMQ